MPLGFGLGLQGMKSGGAGGGGAKEIVVLTWNISASAITRLAYPLGDSVVATLNISANRPPAASSNSIAGVDFDPIRNLYFYPDTDHTVDMVNSVEPNGDNVGPWGTGSLAAWGRGITVIDGHVYLTTYSNTAVNRRVLHWDESDVLQDDFHTGGVDNYEAYSHFVNTGSEIIILGATGSTLYLSKPWTDATPTLVRAEPSRQGIWYDHASATMYTGYGSNGIYKHENVNLNVPSVDAGVKLIDTGASDHVAPVYDPDTEKVYYGVRVAGAHQVRRCDASDGGNDELLHTFAANHNIVGLNICSQPA